ncbi:MATE family efflux transporter [Chakrabartyella piscis]|uniref:MATE family efflux transporter n=1 Tax=Chakrabartyella piscis TaxID=2918914 RepID=UPI002958C85C|nr:MATE family efflux transporter [Chakrabartyella piscis]
MKKTVDLLNGNIAGSLAKLAFPLMGMSLFQMAYNLTDMFWISRLGAGAVASIGTGGLLIWLSQGIHNLSLLGGQVYTAQNLGAQDKDMARTFAHAAMWLSTLISLILGALFCFGRTPITAFFNLNDPEVIRNSEIYLAITGGLIFFMLLSKLLTSLITATGDSKTPFIATTIGLLFNMFLDPALIFGWFGLPALGVAGAAIATVFSQVIVFTVLVHHAIHDPYVFSKIKLWVKPDMTACKEILKLGAPLAFQTSLLPLISMYISRIVAGFGDNAVAVQRIGSQVESLSWMATDGFAVAVSNFIAQNYGANNLPRAKKGFFSAFCMLSIYGCCVTLLLVFCGGALFSIFLDSPDVLPMGIDYLRILGFSQLFLCLEILASNSLSAFGQSKLPAVIATVFSLLRLPLVLWLHTTSLGLNGIWWGVSITTICKGVILFISILIFMKFFLKPIQKTESGLQK